MVQVLKSTKDFEFFGGLNPGTVRVSTENSKATVISGRCAIFRPATAEFRMISSLTRLLPCEEMPRRNWSWS
jgi:hypothetical protein